MAIVEFNPAIKQMRGKSAGANYSVTKYGVEFKSNPTFTAAPTAKQLASRARVAAAGAAYRALTDAQQTA